MRRVTVRTNGYVVRWGGTEFVGLWKEEREFQIVPDAMMSLPSSLNRTQASPADIKAAVKEYLGTSADGGKDVYERISAIAATLDLIDDASRQEFVALMEEMAQHPATPAQKAAWRWLRDVGEIR